MTHRILKVGAAALLLVTAAAATRGGWAVVTVADLPESMTVGKAVTIEYLVRQHGVGVLSDLSGSVTATAGGVATSASMTRARGGYVATFTPPSAGTYAITIRSGFGDVALAPIVAAAPGTTVAPAAPAERGRHLFVAKGCMTCHKIESVAGSGPYGIGPALTAGRLTSEYVAAVLADPTKATPQPNNSFRMPNLNLKAAEITALTAFLTKSDRAVVGERK